MQLEICLEKNYPYPYTKKKNAEYKVHVQVIRKKDLRKIRISSNFFFTTISIYSMSYVTLIPIMYLSCPSIRNSHLHKSLTYHMKE